jgi:hypothetical protein
LPKNGSGHFGRLFFTSSSGHTACKTNFNEDSSSNNKTSRKENTAPPPPKKDALFETFFSLRSGYIARVTGRVCEKVAQNVAQRMLGRNENIAFTEEKSCPRMWAKSAISKKKLPEVINRPVVENSPNLVTLFRCRIVMNRHCSLLKYENDFYFYICLYIYYKYL